MTEHHHHGPDVLGELSPLARELRHQIPDVYSGFVAMSNAAMTDGELPGVTKELIALAIAVSHRCDGCMASHARGAQRKGATRKQVAEAIGVAIMMNGGPGTVYGPRALAAYDEFAAAAGAPEKSAP
jgi:AhpD family alkylhydroperoxidase